MRPRLGFFKRLKHHPQPTEISCRFDRRCLLLILSSPSVINQLRRGKPPIPRHGTVFIQKLIVKTYQEETKKEFFVFFLYIASPQQGDLRLSGPPSGQGAGSGARTRDRKVPADLRADSQATVLPTPPTKKESMTHTTQILSQLF
ncbi:hypothetical protein PoB_006522500 [Plakobranchus ocellatus]|uniref:Uncharacterized protein n=1 Tax=Plakobranchus ocellatus TaxID=259542 RepID=A0AAV4D3P2_9GAST|nr:hypothetical protein PoB_006522500 [Plakobranchus ocellatus]